MDTGRPVARSVGGAEEGMITIFSSTRTTLMNVSPISFSLLWNIVAAPVRPSVLLLIHRPSIRPCAVQCSAVQRVTFALHDAAGLLFRSFLIFLCCRIGICLFPLLIHRPPFSRLASGFRYYYYYYYCCCHYYYQKQKQIWKSEQNRSNAGEGINLARRLVGRGEM